MVDREKAIQEARIIQRSLTSRTPPKEPDFKTIDIAEALPGLNFKELQTVNMNDGAQCCLTCRAENRRKEIHAFGNPGKGGKGGPIIRPMMFCGCAKERERRDQEMADRLDRRTRLQKYYSKNIIAPAIIDATFDNWIARPGTEKAHAAAQAFDQEFEGRTLGLLLTGDPGNGKSHLARAAQKAIDARGWVTLFLDWPQLTELAKATFDQHNFSIADIIRGACDADMLVLDELGAGKLTEWEFKTLLFPLLNGRTGKKTFATTNLDLNELENWFKWGRPEGPERNAIEIDAKGRLFDRVLGNFHIVKNNGASKRREDALSRRGG